MNYMVILFKNKKKKKIINKFKTEEKAKVFFEELKKSNEVYFEKIIDGYNSCDFEIGLITKNKNDFTSYFFKDDYGRQIKLDLDDSKYKLIEISKFSIEEKFVDNQKNKKIDLTYFYENYLSTNVIKIVFVLNNKIFVQEDNNFSMFTFKTSDESLRFLKCLSNFLIDKKRTDCIVVTDTSSVQKKLLYEQLSSFGIDKSILYRRFTTFRK